MRTGMGDVGISIMYAVAALLAVIGIIGLLTAVATQFGLPAFSGICLVIAAVVAAAAKRLTS